MNPLNRSDRSNRRPVTNKAHIPSRNQRTNYPVNTRDDFKDESPDEISSLSTNRQQHQKEVDGVHHDHIDDDIEMETAQTMQAMETMDLKSVEDTSNTNTTTSSVEAVLNEETASSLNPEIAEFDPTSLGTAGMAGTEERGNSVQMSIQLQLFGTLQALNMQQQHVQNQIELALQPRYAELDRALATLRAHPTTDHASYYLIRQQQQAVEQQITASQWTVRQIAEQIQYTRDAYLRQVERVEVPQGTPSGGGEELNGANGQEE